MKPISIICTVLTFSCGSVFALQAAPTNEGEGTTSWSMLDTNKDGKLSVYEAKEDLGILQHFRTSDKNRDGYLSRAEFANALKLNQETEEAE